MDSSEKVPQAQSRSPLEIPKVRGARLDTLPRCNSKSSDGSHSLGFSPTNSQRQGVLKPNEPAGSRPLFIDLFAGCGGLSLGLMLAGWKGLFAVEKDSLAFETLKANLIDASRPDSYDWPKWLPIGPCTITHLLKRYRKEVAALRGTVELIAGGPPCQGFSFAGRRDRHDFRNRAGHAYLEVVKLVRPSFLVFENVQGITIEHGRKARQKQKRKPLGRPPKSYAARITEALRNLGYEVYPLLVKAVDFGIPQFRPRFILIGKYRGKKTCAHKLDIASLISQRRQTFLASKALPLDRPVTVKQAISDLEIRGRPLLECKDSPGFKQPPYTRPRTAYQRLLHGTMNGTAPNSMRLVNHRNETRQRFSKILKTCRRGVQLNAEDRARFNLKKLSLVPLCPELPSHTLTTLPDDLLHYSEPRILTVREYARIQSFPDWYEFHGKYTTGGDRRRHECPRYTQVGNAVPPLFAEFLGKLLAHLKGAPIAGVGVNTSRAEPLEPRRRVHAS